MYTKPHPPMAGTSRVPSKQPVAAAAAAAKSVHQNDQRKPRKEEKEEKSRDATRLETETLSAAAAAITTTTNGPPPPPYHRYSFPPPPRAHYNHPQQHLQHHPHSYYRSPLEHKGTQYDLPSSANYHHPYQVHRSSSYHHRPPTQYGPPPPPRRSLDSHARASTKMVERKEMNGINSTYDAASYAQGFCQNEKAAVSYYRKAAQEGDVRAMQALAECYTHGKGVFVDPSLATHWYNRAQKQKQHPQPRAVTTAGHENSILGPNDPTYRAAMILQEGKDFQGSVKLLKEAAHKGNVAAMYELGVLLVTGQEGVSQDHLLASQSLQMAAHWGSSQAQYALGNFLSQGSLSGMGQDLPAAIRYYKMGAQQGHSKARMRLDMLLQKEGPLGQVQVDPGDVKGGKDVDLTLSPKSLQHQALLELKRLEQPYKNVSSATHPGFGLVRAIPVKGHFADPLMRLQLQCNKYSSDLPDHAALCNFPYSGSQQKNLSPTHACVMCGVQCPFASRNRETMEQKHMQNHANPTHTIPFQNKGVCNLCDVTVWVYVETCTPFKFCKGCKNFRDLQSFGSKAHGTKCERCRKKQQSRYAQEKATKDTKAVPFQPTSINKHNKRERTIEPNKLPTKANKKKRQTKKFDIDLIQAYSGDVDAQLRVAYHYKAGEAVDIDMTRATEYFLQAAQSGHPRAQMEVGMCYFQGQGVAQNMETAAVWLFKACQQKYAPAIPHLVQACQRLDRKKVRAETSRILDYCQAQCLEQKVASELLTPITQQDSMAQEVNKDLSCSKEDGKKPLPSANKAPTAVNESIQACLQALSKKFASRGELDQEIAYKEKLLHEASENEDLELFTKAIDAEQELPLLKMLCQADKFKESVSV